MPDTAIHPERSRGTAVREISYADAIREALAEEMRRDPTVFVIGEDVADVMAAEPIGVHQQKAGTVAAPRALHHLRCGRVDRANVLAINRFRREAERRGAARNVARRRLGVVRVLAVHVVLAHVEHRQRPELCEVHRFVEDALTERAFAEEADRDAILPEHLRGVRRPGRQRRAAAHDRVRAQVPVLVVRDVHRAAFAAAVPGFLAEQLRVHAIDHGALGEAVAVAPVRAGDVVVWPQRLADADRYRLFPYI